MLTTPRLVIRSFNETDAQDLYEYLSLKEVYRYEPGNPVSIVEAQTLACERAKGTNFFAAVLKDKNKMIGHVSLFQVEPKHFLTWDIGYIFNPAFQNNGYCTEAVKAVMGYAFSNLEAHRITGHCDHRNLASFRVLEKCGMRREGSNLKNACFRMDENGKPVWVDSYEYAILEEEFGKS